MEQILFRSLKHRNFRLFFFGQIISVMGTWLQMTAMPWLVYRLTGSALLLGAVGFLSQIFILVLSPFAGIFADHYDKKKLVIITQTISMAQAMLLAILTLTGLIQLWEIVVLSIILGIVNAFDMPARQSFLVEMVNKEDLMNAIGLNSMVFNSARLIGPAIAGILIAAVGEGYCFLINGISFIAVIIALTLIVPLTRQPQNRDASIADKFFSGLNYIRKSKNIAYFLLLLSVTGLTGVFPTILMPVFVKNIYHLGAAGLGIFMSAIGIGALLGTTNIAAKKSIEGIEKTIYTAAISFAVSVIAFSLVNNLFAAVILLVPVGYFLVLQMGLTNTLLQTATPDELRGRVMGFFTMAFMGLAPIGSLLAGVIAEKLGAPVTVTVGGIVSLLVTLLLRKKLFPPRS